MGWEFGRSASALDCRTVRQWRLTSSLRLASPARKLPTLSCTKALFPRHRFPVASSLAHPQMASSAMGYGDGQVVGRSGDQGIDGILNQDKLGLEKSTYRPNGTPPTKLGSRKFATFRAAWLHKGPTRVCLSPLPLSVQRPSRPPRPFQWEPRSSA